MKNYQAQYFSKNERRSLLLLAAIVLILFLTMFLVSKYDKAEIYKMDEMIDNKIIDSIKRIENARNFDDKEKNKVINLKIEYSKFNPNSISVNELKQMGVDNFASSNLEKYRSKGGKIKSIDQFFKIYGMDKFRTKLEPFIELDSMVKKENINYVDNSFSKNEFKKVDNKNRFSIDSIKNEKNKVIELPRKPLVKMKVVEINAADSFELESIYGIGAKLASRIVKYKNRLGGFYEIEQLEEVYGLRAEMFSGIVHLIRVDVSLIKKIQINMVDELTLSAHPYLGRKSAAIIMRYKNNHGIYKNIDDLIKVKIFTDEDISKLKWYIDFSVPK